MSRRNSTSAYRTGGTRGGRDQFNWEDVKTDKDRQSYLGNSLHASTGRWQKGKDILWYTKNGEGGVPREVLDEKARLKALDEELISAALGVAPTREGGSSSGAAVGVAKRPALGNNGPNHTLEADEIRALLSRVGGGAGASGSSSSSAGDPSSFAAHAAYLQDHQGDRRVSGLGAAPAKLHEGVERIAPKNKVEREIEELTRRKQEDTSGSVRGPAGAGAAAAVSDGLVRDGVGRAASAAPSKSSHRESHARSRSRSRSRDSSSRDKDRDRDGGGRRHRSGSRDRDRDRDRGHRHKHHHRDRDGHRSGHSHSSHKHKHHHRDRDGDGDGDSHRHGHGRHDRDRDRDREGVDRNHEHKHHRERSHRDRDRDRDGDRGRDHSADGGRD